MVKKIYAIYDEKSEAYLQPFFLDTNGQAIRAITDCLTDPQHNFSRHPADYTLFLIGEYNDQDASIQSFKTNLGNLIEFKPKSVEVDNVVQMDSILGDTKKIGGSD